MKFFAAVINCTILLALLVIALGAYTRLTDAGLGCPDWPGCYGKLTAPLHDGHVEEAQQQYPDAIIEPHKAHNEMMHRYIAGLLGLCVLAITIFCFRLKQYRILGVSLLALVIFQAALGMWTVTLNLMPLIVLAHLLGGFALFSLLVLLRAEVASSKKILPVEQGLTKLLPFGYAALFVLIIQIALGGWTSSNYAAAVCYDLPFCEGNWQERFSLPAALSVPLGHETYEHGVLPYEARMSIHVLHRIGAICTLVVLGAFAFLCWCRAQAKSMRRMALGIGILLLLQLSLGLINVVAQLPLLNAVAHNLVAANLLMLIVVFVRQINLRNRVENNAPMAVITKRQVIVR